MLLTSEFDFASRFKFISHALYGTGGFFDGTYLVRYPRESDDKYERRREVAWYKNALLSSCSTFVGYITKRAPVRETSNPLFQGIIDDADMLGNSLDVFFSRFMVEAKARGSMLLLVDMPEELPDNLAGQLEKRAFPYLRMLAPEAVVNYRIDARGLLISIEINSEWTDENGNRQFVIRGWDREKWWIRTTAGQIKQADHGLGVCPVLAFTEAGAFPHVGEYAQIADLSRRLYNLRSERDEILRGQTFSLLTLQVPPEAASVFDAAKTAETVSTENILVHHGQQPAFIAPPEGPANIQSSVIAELEENIRQISLTVEYSNQAESGEALKTRFQQLNSALVKFAQSMEDLERRMWWIAGRWLKLKDSKVVTAWAKNYELADVTAELDELERMQATGFPAEVMAEKQKQIATLVLRNKTPDELNELLALITGEHAGNDPGNAGGASGDTPDPAAGGSADGPNAGDAGNVAGKS